MNIITKTNLTEKIADYSIPMRKGAATETVGPMPHRQASERASDALVDLLVDSINALDGISLAKRGGFIGRPYLSETKSKWNAHLHHYEDGAHQDGSMHVALPQKVAAKVEMAGWGERHPAYPAMTLLYSPRNEDEVAVLTMLVQLSHDLN